MGLWRQGELHRKVGEPPDYAMCVQSGLGDHFSQKKAEFLALAIDKWKAFFPEHIVVLWNSLPLEAVMVIGISGGN